MKKKKKKKKRGGVREKKKKKKYIYIYDKMKMKMDKSRRVMYWVPFFQAEGKKSARKAFKVEKRGEKMEAFRKSKWEGGWGEKDETETGNSFSTMISKRDC